MTAIWTAPRTWTAGEIVTATLLNTHLRDNLEYIDQRLDTSLPTATVTSSGSFTSSTSSTFAQILSLSHTYSFNNSHNLMLWFVGAWRHTSTAGELRFTFNVGGTNLGDATYGVFYGEAGVANNWWPLCVTMVVTRPAASSVVLQPRLATNVSTLDVGFGYVQFGYAVLANVL